MCRYNYLIATNLNKIDVVNIETSKLWNYRIYIYINAEIKKNVMIYCLVEHFMSNDTYEYFMNLCATFKASCYQYL